MVKKVLKLSGILCAIAVATSLLLAVTNELTATTILQRQLEAKNAAMTDVLPAKSYNLLKSVPDDYEVYAAFNGYDPIGYTVSLSEYGYGGEIKLMIGIDKNHKIAGVTIIDMSETAGLGDNAKKPEFTAMFKGLEKEEVALTSDGGKIQAITGATVTSTAVTTGVARALEIVSKQIGGGVKVGQ